VVSGESIALWGARVWSIKEISEIEAQYRGAQTLCNFSQCAERLVLGSGSG
jgi:hypothetical protein